MNLTSLTDSQLLDATRAQLRRANEADADLLLLLGEIEDRKLYADRAYSSMFAFCVEELGLSEDAACNRLGVARLARRFPRVLDFLRAGHIHLTGLRLLSPLLTAENLEEVLAAASGKSKRAIEQLIAALAPKPPVPASIRKLPAPAAHGTALVPAAPAALGPGAVPGVPATPAALAPAVHAAPLAMPKQALVLVAPAPEAPLYPPRGG